MAKYNRQCRTCGSKYNYCPSCSKADALKEPWHSTFCCEDCRTIWKTLTKFSMGLLSKIEAKEILSKIELNPLETYAECVQRGLAKVMTEDEIVVVNEAAEEVAIVEQPELALEEIHEIINITEEVVEQPMVEATVDMIIEQPIVEVDQVETEPVQQKHYSKKNKRKSHVVVQKEIQ